MFITMPNSKLYHWGLGGVVWGSLEAKAASYRLSEAMAMSCKAHWRLKQLPTEKYEVKAAAYWNY